MVWVALALLILSLLIVYFNTSARRWDFQRFAGNFVMQFYVWFLLPMWTLSFATESLGRERSDHNLIWLLSRPLSRPAIFLGKYLAVLPWCLTLNLGGFVLLCLAGGEPGRQALEVFWPAVIAGTLCYAALFHLLGAIMRRPAMLALLYSFFCETIAGNLPGHFKRLSITFYTKCLMFERAQDFGRFLHRPNSYEAVSELTAWLVLLTTTAVLLAVGTALFSRGEYLDAV